METEDLTPEQMEEMEDFQEEALENQKDDQHDDAEEFNEAYGSPEPEERQNQHAFLAKAAFKSTDTVRTTYLDQEELGRPLFSVRFLLDLEDISKWYLDSYAIKYGVDKKNRVSDYFLQKIRNITDSGMSKEGFAMNLNVTKKMDTIRKRVRGNIENFQGGKKTK